MQHLLLRLLDKNNYLKPGARMHIDDELLQHVSIITPNETEAFMLTGIKVTDELTAGMQAVDTYMLKELRQSS